MSINDPEFWLAVALIMLIFGLVTFTKDRIQDRQKKKRR
jgi:hypothetical protein